jgi:hypothetical protein
MNLPNPVSEKQVTINIVPIEFSKDIITIGKIEYKNEEEYDDLRDLNWRTHAFRYDSRDGYISNMAITPEVKPLGREETVIVQENLLLLGKAVQQSITNWLSNILPIVKAGKRLTFFGGRSETMLLSQAVTSLELTPVANLDVVVRYDFDTRMFWPPSINPSPYLGLVIDLSTANVLDISLAKLIEVGVDVIGKYVCRREEAEHEYIRPRLDLIGMVSQVVNNCALLTDTDGISEIELDQAYLEPRSEYLDEVIQKVYGEQSGRVLAKLKEIRGSFATANAKLEKIKQTLTSLKKNHQIVLGGDVAVTFGNFLTPSDAVFPATISTTRPNFLFGGQGRNSGSYPDSGVQNWGPYKYSYHKRNAPVIGVVCEAKHRGRVDQFINLLRVGLPDEVWEKATNWQKTKSPNAYQGGLIGKFRLTRADIQFEEAKGVTAKDYREAAERLLARSPKGIDLAIVQIRDEFRKLRGNNNPYFVSKAAFMEAGIPVQAIKIENMEVDEYQLAYILNNLALASYAKLDGTPWVISTLGSATHELIIGLGYAEIATGRLSQKSRYVGINTVFQDDGRYLVWGLTREVEFENYVAALLENLRTTIQYVQEENNWKQGDNVRLIFHVYKPLKNIEIDAIKQLVQTLTSDQYRIEYAFLDISEYHMFQIYDPNQNGKEYPSGSGRRRTKGKGVPNRGLCYQLSNRQGLLQLIGPSDLKTADQGLPKPLLVELHPDSDFKDMTYLLRQIYHFTYMSWQNFFPASEPVTILYSRFIARMLGNLKTIDGWSSKVLSVGSLRERRWFL